MKRAFLAVLLTSALPVTSALLAQTATKATTAAKSTAAAKAPAAKAPAAPAADLLHPLTINRTAPATFRVKLTTTKGDLVIDVTRAWAPRGADRFYSLVRAGYYTDCAFYRVIPGFMAQFGISAKPEVNAAWRGVTIQDDPKNGQSNKRGKLTFASTGSPNSRSNTLFINMVDNGYLDNQGFIPIGEVVEGLPIVDMLYTGYGATEAHQFDFENGGKAYIDKSYPKLDRILTATIVPVPAAAPPAAAAPKQ